MAKKTAKKTTSTKKIEVEVEGNTDSIIADIAGMINKANKEGGNVAFVMGNDNPDDPTKIVDWVPSGNDQLDLIMCNRPDAGYPVGRITEITGLEHSGKTLLSMHALAETQRKDGIAVFIDTESSLDHNFVRAIGVDLDKLLYISCDHVEEIFEHMETIIQKVRLSNKDKLVTIVVDSVAAASCKAEQESDFDQTGFATQKAIIISKALRKITQLIARQRVALIFTNQLRLNLGAVYGDKYTTSGGKALGFHASLRLRLSKAGQILDKPKKNGGRVIGIKTICKMIKNRLGPPDRDHTFNLFFNRGIDNYGDWIETLKDKKIIKGTRTPYTYTDTNGQEILLHKDKFTDLMKSDTELRDELYKHLCDIHIMKYTFQEECASDDILVVEDDDDDLED